MKTTVTNTWRGIAKPMDKHCEIKAQSELDILKLNCSNFSRVISSDREIAVIVSTLPLLTGLASLAGSGLWLTPFIFSSFASAVFWCIPLGKYRRRAKARYSLNFESYKIELGVYLYEKHNLVLKDKVIPLWKNYYTNLPSLPWQRKTDIVYYGKLTKDGEEYLGAISHSPVNGIKYSLYIDDKFTEGMS